MINIKNLIYVSRLSPRGFRLIKRLIIAVIIVSLLDIGILRLSSSIVFSLTTKSVSPLRVEELCIALLFMALITPFIKFYSLRLSNSAASESGRSWSSILSREFCEADFNKIRESTAADCITTMTTNLDQSVFFLQNYLNRIYSTINIAAIVIYVVFTNGFLLVPILFIGLTYFAFSRFIPSFIRYNSSLYLRLQSEIVQNAKSIYEGNREIRTGKMSKIVSEEVSNNYLFSKQAWFRNQELLQVPKFAIDSIIYLLLGLCVYLVFVFGRGLDAVSFLSNIALSFIVMVKIASPLQQLYASNGLLKTYRESFLKIFKIVTDYTNRNRTSKLCDLTENTCFGAKDNVFFPIEIKFKNKSPVVINKGSVIGITGKSGSGKSTLIDCLIGFTCMDDIKVTYGGSINTDLLAEISSGTSKIGYCPQASFVFNGSLRDNISCKSDVNIEDEYYSYLVRLFGLEHLADIYITSTSLSGGEKQRITLARELIKRPNYLFLDECTSALDSYNRNKVLGEIMSTHQNRYITIFVDHNQEVLDKCEQLITLQS